MSPAKRAKIYLGQSLGRLARRNQKKSGQMMIIFALTWALFVGGLVIVFNSGYMVGERIRIQQIADNAAYSGAVWEARCFNFVAYCNRAIVADLAFLAYLTAMQSHLEAWAMLIDYLATLSSFIPYVGAIINQVLSTVSDIIEEAADAVGDLKDSSLWEAVMDSLYYSQQAMLGYTLLTVNEIMQEVASDADPNVDINGNILSPIRAINLDNHEAVYRDAQGEGDDLQWLTEQTISEWTKGEDLGVVPLGNREWMLIPYSVEESVLKWVSITTGLPSNFGIEGNMDINNNGTKSRDFVYIAWWYYKWPTLTSSGGPRRVQVPISIYFYAERDIDWNDIGFYKYDPDGPRDVGIWAIAEKSGNTLNNFIYRTVVAAPFAGGGDTLVVPNEDLSAISKAAARYVDPSPGSGRHSTLVSQDREPNLFNPFWIAELVPVNHDQSGVTPDQDESGNAAEIILQTEFDTWSVMDFWYNWVRH